MRRRNETAACVKNHDKLTTAAGRVDFARARANNHSHRQAATTSLTRRPTRQGRRLDSRRFKYKAFLSYSHRDERWARWLHGKLESYRVPQRLVGTSTSTGVVPPRLIPIFRDRDELPTATDLGATINKALEESGALIVICSPAAAASRWVNEEILAFKRLGRADRIFCMIVAGEPHAAEQHPDSQQECFPPALRYRLAADGSLSAERSEPIAADARDGKDGRTGVLLKIVAGLLGVGLDELRQREQQRRQRRLVAVTGASLAGMLLASTLAGFALHSRAEAERQRRLAEVEAETARQTTDFLVSLFSVADPSEARGNTVTAREILDRGARRIEIDLAQQPAVRANLMHTMGEVYTGLGLYEPASRLLGEAVDLQREIAAEPHPRLVASANSLGATLYLKGEYGASQRVFEDALAAARALDSEPNPMTSRAMTGLADVYTQAGDDDTAEQLYREALAMDRALHGDRHPDVARGLAGLARSLLFQGRLDEAEPLFSEALEIRIATLGDDHPLVAETGNNLASLYYFAGDYDAAERQFRATLPRYRHIFGDEHPEVSSIVNNLGRVLLERNRLTEAEELLREAVAVDRKLKDPQHDDLVFPLNSLGLALTALGRLDEAEPLLREALQIARLHEHRMEGPVLSNLADLLCRAGRFAEAADASSATAARLAADYPDEAWRSANLDSIRGGCLVAQQRHSEAEVLLRNSIEPLRQRWGDDGLFTRSAVARLDALERSRDPTGP